MLEIEVKEDSAEKLASVQGKPTKYYLFSQEFNAIVQKINEVYLGQNPNRITGLGTETVDGNQHTYQGYSWIINGADLDNIDNPSVIVIPTASVGFRRKDISVFNEFGNIVRVPGIETDGDIATTPDVPENTIYFRTYDVVGDLITSDETPPFVGIEYKSKRESDSYTYDNAGENVILPLPGEGQSHLIVENEDIVSIDGFDKTILILVRNGEYPYEGKDYLFENKSPNPVQLNHLTSAEIPSILPNEENVVVPSGGSVWFKFKGEKMAYIMKSWNDPVDLSTKADLVGGKVPAEQLPSYVDDVLEFANFAAFPLTGENSKIYLALDSNFTYRWSGSAYVKISDSGKLDKVTTGSVRRIYGIDASNNQEMIPVSEFVTKNTQIFHWWGGNWTTTTLGNYYYISYSNAAIEGLNNSISASMNGRNKGLFIAPFNCKIKRVIFKEGGSGSYTGAFVLASGLPNYGGTWNNGYTNVVTHLNQAISAAGYEQHKNEFLVTDNITVPKGYAVCPMLVFSAQVGASKVGVEISVEIEEVV